MKVKYSLHSPPDPATFLSTYQYHQHRTGGSVIRKSQVSIMVQMIKDMKDLKALLRTAGHKLVVVEFSAKWCGPCQNIGPLFEAMSSRYQNVMFANVDVDCSKELAQHCNIKAVPTFQMFKNTQKIFEFCGADVKKLEVKIRELM